MSSLVCSVVDTGIANAYGSATEGWYATMMAQGNLRQDVSTHRPYSNPYTSAANSHSRVTENDLAQNRVRTPELFCSVRN